MIIRRIHTTTATAHGCSQNGVEPHALSAACGAKPLPRGWAHVFEHAADADCLRMARTSLEAVTCACRWHGTVVRACRFGSQVFVACGVPPAYDRFAPRCTYRAERRPLHCARQGVCCVADWRRPNLRMARGSVARCASQCCHSDVSAALSGKHPRTHEEIAHGTGAEHCAFMGISCGCGV